MAGIGVRKLILIALAVQADPAQVLSVPVVPLGTLLAAAYPLSSQSSYVFSWLNNLISAEDMMHPDLLKKLVQNNFCKYPSFQNMLRFNLYYFFTLVSLNFLTNKCGKPEIKM